MSNRYYYKISATTDKEEFLRLAESDFREKGLTPVTCGNTVTVEGEAEFETCMLYLAIVLHYPEHEVYMSVRG